MTRRLMLLMAAALVCVGTSTRVTARAGGSARVTAQAAKQARYPRWLVLRRRAEALRQRLGYEIGAQRPASVRASCPELDRMRADLKLIKAAGFNAIRTWSQLDAEELAVVRDRPSDRVRDLGAGEDFSDLR
jgi:hypothetical protein